MNKIVMFTSLMLMFLSCGCGNRTKLYVLGEVYYYVGYDLYQRISVIFSSDPIANHVVVSVNGKSLEKSLIGSCPEYDYWFYSYDSLTPDAEYKLEIQTDLGNADAVCTLPGGTNIINPPLDTTIVAGEPLPINWSRSSNMDWYCAIVAFYIDPIIVEPDKDTVIYTTDTAITIPSGWVNSEGRVAISLFAGNGPSSQEGSGGNISGADGYWVGLFCVGRAVYTSGAVEKKTSPEAIEMLQKNAMERFRAVRSNLKILP